MHVFTCMFMYIHCSDHVYTMYILGMYNVTISWTRYEHEFQDVKKAACGLQWVWTHDLMHTGKLPYPLLHQCDCNMLINYSICPPHPPTHPLTHPPPPHPHPLEGGGPCTYMSLYIHCIYTVIQCIYTVIQCIYIVILCIYILWYYVLYPDTTAVYCTCTLLNSPCNKDVLCYRTGICYSVQTLLGVVYNHLARW